MSIIIKRITQLTDIDVKKTNELWRLSDAQDHNTDPQDYDPEALARYVADPANIVITAFINSTPVGFMLATIIKKPYKSKDFLYIDEVDVHAYYRSQGIGKAMMKEAFRIASVEYGLQEAWVGTEPDNVAARALYESLGPTETEHAIGYTFQL